MAEKLPVAVLGASGRMGRMLVQTVESHPDCRLCGVTERPGSDWIGRDLGECIGGARRNLRVSDDPLEVFAAARAVLDFTAPAASVEHAALAAQARLVHVLGTTGLTEGDLARIAAAAHHAVIIRSGNFSLGVNLLAALTARVAGTLGEDYDIEILETHHNQKADAPSGTALMLGAAAARGRGVTLADASDRARDGQTGPRRKGAIGFASLRAGGVVGEHEVIFGGPGERLVLRHIADDRALFARGAIRAALWGQGRKPGEYSMADVLGL
jgi:4-hydroxy-tetrahydrodipicolinate reductase